MLGLVPVATLWPVLIAPVEEFHTQSVPVWRAPIVAFELDAAALAGPPLRVQTRGSRSHAPAEVSETDVLQLLTYS